MSAARDAGRPFTCRAVLREALTATAPLPTAVQQHVDACSFCAARVRARTRLLPALRQRPPMPAVPVASLMSGVHERFLEHAESGPVGALLADAVPMPAVELRTSAWPEDLLASDVARRVAESPPAAGSVAWSRMRESILDRLADRVGTATASQRPARSRWWVGLVGTAVAAGVALAVLDHAPPEPPTITFHDISRLPTGGAFPAVDFAVVRHGVPR